MCSLVRKGEERETVMFLKSQTQVQMCDSTYNLTLSKLTSTNLNFFIAKTG